MSSGTNERRETAVSEGLLPPFPSNDTPMWTCALPIPEQSCVGLDMRNPHRSWIGSTIGTLQTRRCCRAGSWIFDSSLRCPSTRAIVEESEARTTRGTRAVGLLVNSRANNTCRGGNVWSVIVGRGTDARGSCCSHHCCGPSLPTECLRRQRGDPNVSNETDRLRPNACQVTKLLCD